MNPNRLRFFLQYIRIMVYSISVMVWISLFSIAQLMNDGIYLGRWYAYTSLIFLYLTLLASPLYSVFPALPYKPIYVKARKALGVSAFFFALLHAYTAFFNVVGGFAALPFVSGKFLLSLAAGFTALSILTIMAITSLDWMIQKLGRYWKPLHRLVYFAAFMILLHGTTVTAHFLRMRVVMVLFYIAVALLLGLEAIRLDKHLARVFKITFQPATFIAYPIAALAVMWLLFFSVRS
jgi:DMSO/TMAO reductase YedYZ heme-binding membrane subunit